MNPEAKVPLVVGVSARSGPGDPNNGNMIHAAAARRLLSRFEEGAMGGVWPDAYLERVRAGCSHIVVVAANMLRLNVPGDHPGIRPYMQPQVDLAENIRRAKLPVAVFGLGSQAPDDQLQQVFIASETLDLLRAISEHSAEIAVRGAYTADVCCRLGVKNTKVIGCQSIFWHRTPTVAAATPDLRAITPEDAPQSVSFNFTYGPSEANLINQAMRWGLDVVGQGNVAEEEIAARGHTSQSFRWNLPVAFDRRLIDSDRYCAWIKHHFFQFHDPDAWISHLRRYRFSYGTRLHGNIVALIAGVPAVWIVHDQRTREVCEHFHLPFIEIAEVANKGISWDRMISLADDSQFARTYPSRYRSLFDYLERAQLPHLLPAPDEPANDHRSADPVGAPGRPAAGSEIGAPVQIHLNTKYDRYPWIFSRVKALSEPRRPSGNPLNILSFGCAAGDEAMALAEKYFCNPADRVLGVDIRSDQIELATQRNSAPDRISFAISSDEVLRAHAPFDAVFAMSVLCVWPETKDMTDISQVFDMRRFAALVDELDRHLSVGGFLVIYNANFRFCDTQIYERYRAIEVAGRSESGFVAKFDRFNKRCPAFDAYGEVVFEKLR